MKINFYEEYPTEKNLEKLKFIGFPTKIFIASKSLKEFKQRKKLARSFKSNISCVYWPIIPKSYWISPLSNTKDLIKLFKELDSCSEGLLIDLELPFSSNKKLFFKNLFSFRKNKRLIKKFLEKNKSRITCAELPLLFINQLLILTGISYKISYKKSLMWYSSMVPEVINKLIKKSLKKIKQKKNYSISLGTIATGFLGNEPILSPEKLEKDLRFLKKQGFEEVVIFRLGGLNKKYADVLNKSV